MQLTDCESISFIHVDRMVHSVKAYLSFMSTTWCTQVEIKEHLLPHFTQLDRDGLHDLNIQADWQRKTGTYWVRYVHVELLGFTNVARGQHPTHLS